MLRRLCLPFASFALASLLLACATCGGSDGSDDDPPPRRELGLSDISFLLPLPADPASPLLASAAAGFSGSAAPTPLLPRALYESLFAAPGDIAPKTGAVTFEQFHAVAVRFDLCDRQDRAPCPDSSDGVFRVVLQPTYLATAGGGQELRAHDVALHAFYLVPNADLPKVIAELRVIGGLAGLAADAPLSVYSPLASASASAAKTLPRLRSLLSGYVRQEQLTRLTAFGQDANSVAFAWIFRGVERPSLNAAFAPIAIPQIGSAQQSVRLGGGDTIYLAEPIADLPVGFELALNGPTFNAAPIAQRQAALRALVAVDNPSRHDTGDTQCLSCHVSTFLVGARQAGAGLDAAALPEHFRAPPYDLTTGGLARSDARVLRGFGYAASSPVISQRVVNETAQVLGEIARRYPPPP